MLDGITYAPGNRYRPVPEIGTRAPLFGRKSGGGRFSANPWRRIAQIFRKNVAASDGAGAAMAPAAASLLLDTLGDWICGLDASARLTFANASFVRDFSTVDLTGRRTAATTLSGRRFFELLPAPASEALRLAFHRAIAGGKPHTCQHEIPLA